jgi:hypothetical protein
MITIYNQTTGIISKVCNCLESDIFLQYDSSIESYIDGNYDYNSYYIQDNQPVAIPNAPNQYYVFDYNTKQWVDPRTDATQWPIVKSQRNALLVASDWTQLPDVPLSDKAAWADYRQALRDITKQADPFNIIWPTPPAG